MTHPVNQGLSAAEVATYNSYLGSGLKTGVTAANSYDSIVPFQSDNLRNYTTLKGLANSDGSNRNGPAGRPTGSCAFPATGPTPQAGRT